MIPTVRPLSLREANDVVSKWHSHHKPSRGHKFSLGLFLDEECLGAVIVGRPVAPGLQAGEGITWEVTRLCTNGFPNAASMLLGRSWRAARAMGVTRLVSYTRSDEEGTAYKAAGWSRCATVKGRPWTTGNKADRWLPGLYQETTEIIDRIRWEAPGGGGRNHAD